MDEERVNVITILFNGVIHNQGLLNAFADLSETKTLMMFSSARLKRFLK